MEIKIGGHRMDMSDEPWRMELVNPLWSFDKITGTRAYEIKLSATDLNLSKLGNVHHPAVRSGRKLFETEIAKGNITIEKGHSVVKDAVNGITLGFTSNISEVFGTNQGLSLRDINFGIKTMGATEIANSLNNTWNVNGWVLPMFFDSIYYDNGNAPGGWDSWVNKYESLAYTSAVKVPCFFVKYIMKAVADASGVKFAGDFWESDQLNKMLFFNTKSAVATIDVRKHLPDMTIAEWVLALRKAFNLLVRIDTKSKTIRLDKQDLKIASAPTRNWSNKCKRIVAGTPTWTNGLRLRVGNDTNEGLKEDAYFLPWESGVAISGLEWTEISTQISGTTMNGGYPKVMMKGVTTNQEENDFGCRIVYWEGNAISNSSYGGVATTAAGLGQAYWSETRKLMEEGYWAEEEIALTTEDIIWLSNVISGRIADAPIVHIWGNNWIPVTSMVGDMEGETVKIKLLRI